MAQVTLELGTVLEARRVVDALCEAHGYIGTEAGKPAAAKGYIRDWVINIVVGVETARAVPAPPVITRPAIA